MQRATLPTEKLDRWRVSMIVAWFAGSFGMVFFARDLQFVVLGWPLSFWFASQGIVLMFVLIVAAYAWGANKADAANAVDEVRNQRARSGDH